MQSTSTPGVAQSMMVYRQSNGPEGSMLPGLSQRLKDITLSPAGESSLMAHGCSSVASLSNNGFGELLCRVRQTSLIPRGLSPGPLAAEGWQGGLPLLFLLIP